MIDRRRFLSVSVGSLAATALGGVAPPLAIAAPPGSGVRWTPGRLLPRFRAPERLWAADVRGTDRVDRLLLTTLQGVVNRRQPRIHLTFDPVDDTWLRDSGVRHSPVTEPLSLVDRFRSEVRGAVVYDPAVPDSVNVATTLAGLEDAVVAHPSHVEALGLPVVDDLRGRFEDDRLAIYRWQLEQLFPRCTHRLLAGLPPTTTESTPGVQWREIARETRQIRDSSNRGTYTFDLSTEVAAGTGEVFLRFADAFTGDGWGASVRHVVVRDEQGEVARFEPGTAAEEPFLFDGSRSQIGGEGNRFADGSGFFVYRFVPRAGTSTLVVQCEMRNQYVVTATDTAPTQKLPFPFFRDFVVATRAMVTWLPPAGETGALLTEIFDAVPPTTPYAGWFSDDVQGEWSGVDLASQHSVEVLPADFYMNGTVHAGVEAKVSSKVRRPRRSSLQDKVYLTLTFGEGDNVQYCQRRMRDIWDDPRRGEAPMNWTVSPVLRDIGPALLAHYQRTATANDLLIAGPSGAGYTYLDSWPREAVTSYLDVTGRYLDATGMDLVYAYNQRRTDGPGWVPFSREVVTEYARRTQVRGIVQSWETGDLLESYAGVPVIGNLYPVGGPAAYRDGLLRLVQDWDGGSPYFVAGAVNAWSWRPSDVVELVDVLDDRFEIVLADEFFTLLARHLAGGR